MVKKNKRGWICEECKLLYPQKYWAERYEEWCKKHRSCNLEIIKHARGREIK